MGMAGGGDGELRIKRPWPYLHQLSGWDMIFVFLETNVQYKFPVRTQHCRTF